MTAVGTWAVLPLKSHQVLRPFTGEDCSDVSLSQQKVCIVPMVTTLGVWDPTVAPSPF